MGAGRPLLKLEEVNLTAIEVLMKKGTEPKARQRLPQLAEDTQNSPKSAVVFLGWTKCNDRTVSNGHQVDVFGRIFQDPGKRQLHPVPRLVMDESPHFGKDSSQGS